MKKYNVKVCLCPRSNEYLGLNKAPWNLFKKANVIICLGTDSLASNKDLNLFKEMAYLLDKGVFSSEELLKMGTFHGSLALGKGYLFGTIAPNAYSKLLFAEISNDKDLAESVIRAGVEEKIRWIENVKLG